MSVFEKLKKIFGIKRKVQPIESDFNRFQSDYQSIQSIASDFQSIENRQKEELRESFKLGLAAGYTGKSIKEIESTLHRIESQMVTKDWFLMQFEDKTPELIDLIKKHEENERQRYEEISRLLHSLQKSAEKIEEPVLRKELLDKITTIKKHIPLTPKMQGLILTVKEFGEISYEDLAIKLGISVPGLRGLLSNTLKRTDKLERFIRNGKGWVRYIGD